MLTKSKILDYMCELVDYLDEHYFLQEIDGFSGKDMESILFSTRKSPIIKVHISISYQNIIHIVVINHIGCISTSFSDYSFDFFVDVFSNMWEALDTLMEIEGASK